MGMLSYLTDSNIALCVNRFCSEVEDGLCRKVTVSVVKKIGKI
jgi:hypothetical protein